MTVRNKISRTLGDLKGRMYDLAFKANVIEGHYNYEKFIILGMGRTGSNMLTSSLRSHGQVVAFGEIFNNAKRDMIFWNYPDYVPKIDPEKTLSVRESAPETFLNSLVFRRFPKKITAVGFKIFYFHAHEDNWKCVWSYLKSASKLKVIHIKRKNMLDTVRSIRIAHRDKEWTAKGNTGSRIFKPVTLEYDWCRETFQTIRKWEKSYDEEFKNHEKIDVVYEDMVREYEHQMKRVQEFLCVKIEKMQPSTEKQNVLSQSEVISNYWELKERFAGSPWAEFFKE